MQVISEMTNQTTTFFVSTLAPRSSAAPKAKETIAEQLRRELTAVMVALTPEGRDQVVAEIQTAAKRARQPVRLASRAGAPVPARSAPAPLVDTPATRAAARALFNFDLGGLPDGDD